MGRMMRIVALTLLSLSTGIGILLAQTGATSLRGTIIDRSGAAIVQAKVTLTDPAKALERQTTTSDSGVFEFPALPPGTYVLSVEMGGFRTYQRRNLQLLVDSPGTADVTLEIGAASQTVEVSAETTTINTSDASLGNAFSERATHAHEAFDKLKALQGDWEGKMITVCS